MKNKLLFTVTLVLVSTSLFAQGYWYTQFRNSIYFDDDKIGVGINTSAIQRDSPYSEYVYTNDVINLAAYDDQVVTSGSTTRKITFNDTEGTANKSQWRLIIPGESVTWSSDSQTPTLTVTTDKFTGSNPIVQAEMKYYNLVKFSNEFNGTTETGNMKVKGVTYSAPTSNFEVVEQNSINVVANNNYDFDNIRYLFTKWNDNNTSNSRTIYPSNESEYIAEYTGYPIYTEAMRNISYSSVRQGDVYYLKLDWDEHPNSYITQYKIYRYTKEPDGSTTNPVQIGTTNRGTTTYTDSDFNYNPLTGDHQIYYDVRAYFSLDGTTSPVNYSMAKGSEAGGGVDKKGSEIEELITDYAISNYPNPFNPTTTIQYQLPQAGFVQIKVYDALGKQVATLVNKQHERGRYEVTFGDNNLPSGLYIYTIQANEYYESKKMLLVK